MELLLVSVAAESCGCVVASRLAMSNVSRPEPSIFIVALFADVMTGPAPPRPLPRLVEPEEERHDGGMSEQLQLDHS